MSLVGTRPPTVNEFKQYQGHHKRRLSMKPGITGMWQAYGRSTVKDLNKCKNGFGLHRPLEPRTGYEDTLQDGCGSVPGGMRIL